MMSVLFIIYEFCTVIKDYFKIGIDVHTQTFFHACDAATQTILLEAGPQAPASPADVGSISDFKDDFSLPIPHLILSESDSTSVSDADFYSPEGIQTSNTERFREELQDQSAFKLFSDFHSWGKDFSSLEEFKFKLSEMASKIERGPYRPTIADGWTTWDVIYKGEPAKLVCHYDKSGLPIQRFNDTTLKHLAWNCIENNFKRTGLNHEELSGGYLILDNTQEKLRVLHCYRINMMAPTTIGNVEFDVPRTNHPIYGEIIDRSFSEGDCRQISVFSIHRHYHILRSISDTMVRYSTLKYDAPTIVSHGIK